MSHFVLCALISSHPNHWTSNEPKNRKRAKTRWAPTKKWEKEWIRIAIVGCALPCGIVVVVVVATTFLCVCHRIARSFSFAILNENYKYDLSIFYRISPFHYTYKRVILLSFYLPFPIIYLVRITSRSRTESNNIFCFVYKFWCSPFSFLCTLWRRAFFIPARSIALSAPLFFFARVFFLFDLLHFRLYTYALIAQRVQAL